MDNYQRQAAQAVEAFLRYDHAAIAQKLRLPLDGPWLETTLFGQPYRLNTATGAMEKQEAEEELLFLKYSVERDEKYRIRTEIIKKSDGTKIVRKVPYTEEAKAHVEKIKHWEEVLSEQLQKHDIGLALVNVTIQDSEPPTTEIMEAFKNVETAKQGKETAINNANKYRNEQIPAAQADADRIVQAAEAKKAARIAEAEGEVAKFNKVYEEYQKYPQVTKKRMFYETMEEVLPDLEVVISDGNVTQYMPVDAIERG